MKLKKSLFFVGFLGVIYSFYQTDYLNWNENQKLKFENFKAKAPGKLSKTTGEIYTEISWIKSQKANQAPTFTIINRMDQSKSWINRKDQDLLNQKQLQFDISELYARKIRKDIKNLNSKKIVDDKSYTNAINLQYKVMNQEQRRYQNMLAEQPNLLKIINTKYQDSLKLYKDFIN